ncbi:hypothetical protein [Pandoraea anhela]|uniref:Uncharacterized protein n=1 Tax=Pandoraea anhela TaxID=2508295 RepID=A0A5E4WZS5_9BURK|nr:hypothetical protein [Pandoraea anhela]VVE29527.1 hypothetical protein PAN31108_03557 [Pandoraea anhela]
MNVDHQPAAGAQPLNLSTPVLEPIYRSLCWVDVVNIRALNPKCNPTKAAMAAAAVHPDSVFGREVERYIGKTTVGQPARNAEQATALRRLSVLEDHEITLDALRDTGLPTDLAVDLLRRLIPRPTGWTIFERLAGTPTLDTWAHSVLTRDENVHVADDIVTLRILQTFGHDIAVPWSLDTTNKWVYFYSAAGDANSHLARVLDIATLDRPNCYAMRDACRKAYQALAYCHYGAGGQIWPHWEATRDIWQIHPDQREGIVIDDIVSHNAITCDTERWLRNVTTVGCLDVSGYSPRTGADYESDLSDPENVACDARRARIAPSDLRERLAVTPAHRRAAQRAALPPPPPPPAHRSHSAPAATDR